MNYKSDKVIKDGKERPGIHSSEIKIKILPAHGSDKRKALDRLIGKGKLK